jgi:hypothetical protein
MLYSEIIAVCSQIHTKHINTLCGQKVELSNVKLVVHIVTTMNHVVKASFRSAVALLLDSCSKQHPRNVQNVSFIASLNMAALSYRKPVAAGTIAWKLPSSGTR